MKRIFKGLCFIFVFVMMLGIMPLSISAVASDTFQYTIKNGEVTITKYIGKDTEVEIPATIEGKPVVSIGNSAFSYCSSLTEIIIPDSVISIGYSAFYECSSLREVIISDSAISIGGSAFYRCSSLTKVIIPDSVTSIGNGAFYECSSLTEIIIPDSVTSIGDSAFYKCNSLTEINVDEDNPNYSSENGILFDKNKTFLIQYPSGKTDIFYTIPRSVTSIGGSAFFWCRTLTKVIIPDSVTSIGNGAFYCSNLSEIIIPDSVTSIGNYVFYGCDSLSEVIIPDSVISIGDSAFQHCESLREVIIPDSVISIGDSAFYRCSNLSEIIIPDSVTSIEYSAFYLCRSLTKVIIPDSVISIGSSAFGRCDNLKTAYFKHLNASTITTFGLYVFNNTHLDFKIIYPANATGFTTPEWQGYPAYPYVNSVVGDLNGDSSVDMIDLLILARHIAELETIKDPIFLEMADVNGDGKVNIADLIRLARWLVGVDLSLLGK